MNKGMKQAMAERLRPDEDVAIVGMACRFPGANSLDEYWDVVSQGRCVVRELPPERWSVDEFYSADANEPGKINSRQAGYIDDPDLFDASFFGVSPREARRMDPQQRLLLETSWHALEDADIVPSSLAGSHTGVFIGIMGCEWGGIQLTDIQGVDSLTGPGSGYCITPNRVSYHFDFKGPSIGYDTACSSSLVATAAAIQSLRRGECPVALAGGVNLVMLPGMNLFYTKAGLSATDGTCKPFSKHADGLGRSEGVGVVVLKLLSDALASDDRIYAIIRGAAVNQDGRSNGLTAPSRWGQEDLLRLAFKSADVEPREIQYIEAHGTGTVLGDLIEARALGSIMADVRPVNNPCYLGSVKGNMSHLEGAAGIAGLIKLALSIKNNKIPPSLHSADLNPDIPFQDFRLKVPQVLTDWPDCSGHPRFGGVSSFGIGGTNAHIVLMDASVSHGEKPTQIFDRGSDERPAQDLSSIEPPVPAVLTFSAKSEEALRDYATGFLACLDKDPEVDLLDLCHGSNFYRSHFSVRAATTVVTVHQLREELRTLQEKGHATGRLVVGSAQRKAPKIAFVFTGQGSQYVGMGQTLYRQNPVFRAAIDNTAVIFERYTGESLYRTLFGENKLLDSARFVQPAMYAFGHAIAQLWDSLGIRPSIVLGHSLGEYAAAAVAGRLPFEEGLALVAKRSVLMEELDGEGGMLVVFADAAKIDQELQLTASEVVVSADNAPGICTVSGSLSDLDQLKTRLIRDGYQVKNLSVSHAFHSRQMDGMLREFEAFANALENTTTPLRGPADIELISSTTGLLVPTTIRLDGVYWAEQVRKPVRFRECIEEARGQGCEIFLEIGPGRVLSPLVDATLGANSHTISSLDPKRGDIESICDAIARIYCLGATVDFSALMGETTDRRAAERVALPKYPFQQKSYWLNVSGNNRKPAWSHALHPSGDGATSGTLAENNRSTHSSFAPPKQGKNGDVRDIVHAAVSEVCGADIASVKPETLLVEELGFSSLMVADLVVALRDSVPDVASIPMSFFFNGASVADLLSLCRDESEDGLPDLIRDGKSTFNTDTKSLQPAIARCKVWAKESRDGIVNRVAARSVHQQNDSNVLLARHELLSPTIAIGEAAQDLTHSFFYDHPQDHVPGVYVIESVRQLITASSHAYFGVSEGSRFVLTDLNIKFNRFVDTDCAFFMILDNVKSIFEDGAMTFINSMTHIVQNGSVIGTVHGQGRVMDLQEYQGAREAMRMESSEASGAARKKEKGTTA